MPGMPRMVVLGVSADSQETPSEHIKRHIAECRDGDVTGYACMLSDIKDNDQTWHDFGVTDAERTAWLLATIELGQAICDEVHDGNIERTVTLAHLLSVEEISDHLPMTSEMLSGIMRDHAVEHIRQTIDNARIGNFENFLEAAEPLRLGLLPYEEVGLTEEEFAELGDAFNDSIARQVFDECTHGTFDRLGTLEEMLECGAISDGVLKEFGVVDLEKFKRARHLAIGKEILRDAHDRDNPFGLLRLQDAIEEGTYTFHDLGITRKQYRKLINPHPVRRFIAKRIRSIGNVFYTLAFKIDS